MEHSRDIETWEELCVKENNIPVFLQPWWWNIVAGKSHWNVLLAKSKKHRVLGAFLYLSKHTWGIKRLSLPVFTPYNGFWFAPIDTGKAHSLLSQKRKILVRIIEQIPSVSLQDFKINYDVYDSLPFKWAGYHQTTHYTQVLDLSKPEDEIFAGFKSATRTKIRNLQGILTISKTEEIEIFLDHINRVFAFKNIPLTKRQLDIIRQLDQEIQKQKTGDIYAAKDEQERIHAMIYVIYSADSAHYWLGGASPEYRDSNGMFYLLWETIKKAKMRANKFDFDGSNHPNIAPVFTGFGAEPKAMHYLYKSSNLFFRILRQIIHKDGR